MFSVFCLFQLCNGLQQERDHLLAEVENLSAISDGHAQKLRDTHAQKLKVLEAQVFFIFLSCNICHLLLSISLSN